MSADDGQPDNVSKLPDPCVVCGAKNAPLAAGGLPMCEDCQDGLRTGKVSILDVEKGAVKFLKRHSPNAFAMPAVPFEPPTREEEEALRAWQLEHGREHQALQIFNALVNGVAVHDGRVDESAATHLAQTALALFDGFEREAKAQRKAILPERFAGRIGHCGVGS